MNLIKDDYKQKFKYINFLINSTNWGLEVDKRNKFDVTLFSSISCIQKNRFNIKSFLF